MNSGKPATGNAVGNPEPSRRNAEGAETIPKGSRVSVKAVRRKLEAPRTRVNG